MRWRSKDVLRLAKKDFEKAWIGTKDLIPKESFRKYPLVKTGKSHVVFDTIQKIREAYINLGFEEVINPLVVEDKEVKRQFGPEATTVLDRCYYLGGLPRPDIGLGDERIEEIEKLGGKVNKDSLQQILREYKKGAFGGEELIYKVARSLGVDDSLAIKIIDKVFSEFRALEPVPTRLILRSHMTSGWFLTLQKLTGIKQMPIKLFSVDRCFRREQREDETHLKTHHSASCVVLDYDVSVQDGKAVAEALLRQFGFKDLRFKLDEKRSKYYAPNTQTEVYVHGKIGWVEVATFGLYSPVALSRYGIENPVMNLGLGVERLAMVLYGIKDVRELVYPQFYKKFELEDKEIATMIKIDKTPTSEEGKEIATRIIEAAEKYRNEKSPCEFVVYSGKLSAKKVEVKVVEREHGKKLLGPAIFNEIYVYEGSIYGLPPQGYDKIKSKGIYKFRYIDAIADFFAYEIEKEIERGAQKVEKKIQIVKNPGDINIIINDVAVRYLQSLNKKIDVRGPVFISIEAKVI